MRDKLSCLRCPGCGAPVYAGDEKCRYCDRRNDWEAIERALPDDYEMLWADGIPVEIVWKPPRIPTKTTR
ncbi:MAG: hypothetical protein IKP72_17135 [Clostridia bacterium]|nr:hypothetical protein [Clostridia bacterium]